MNETSERLNDEFYELATRHLAGDLNADEETALFECLATSEACRQALSDIALQARLISASPARLSPLPANDVIQPEARGHIPGLLGHAISSFNRPVFWATLAAGILFAAYAAVISWDMLGKQLASNTDQLSPIAPGGRGAGGEGESVATIQSTEDAVGLTVARGTREAGRRRNAPGEGAAIAANLPLSIQSGLIELQLTGGTTLLVEGPADWQITGENSATLTKGKLVAQVPPQAIGFTLETPTAKIIDLGTEFGVEVRTDGVAAVQVLKGEVDIQSPNPSRKPGLGKVKAGQSMQITAEGATVTSSPTLPDKFKRLVDAGNKKEQIAAKPGSPLARWREASQKLRTDPSLIAYYDFESQGEQLKNVLADKLHGEIITAREKLPWTDGRWYGKHALVFGKDFASVSISDDSSLTTKGDWTFAVWFRVDAPPARNSYLPILVKGYPHRNYSLWIQPDDALHMSTSYADGSRVICRSAKPVQQNQWHFVVGVMDGRKMRLYLNGAEACAPQPMHEGLAVDDQPLLLGQTRELPHHPNRFIGVIDELAIYSRALSADEIAEMYRTGKPD